MPTAQRKRKFLTMYEASRNSDCINIINLRTQNIIFSDFDLLQLLLDNIKLQDHLVQIITLPHSSNLLKKNYIHNNKPSPEVTNIALFGPYMEIWQMACVRNFYRKTSMPTSSYFVCFYAATQN